MVNPDTEKQFNLKADIKSISESRHLTKFYFSEDGLVFLGSDEGFFIIEIEKNLFNTYIADKNPTVSTRAIIDYSPDSILIFAYGNTYAVHKKNGGERLLLPFKDLNFYGAIKGADGAIWMGSHSMELTRFDPRNGDIRVFKAKKAPAAHRATLRPFQDANTGRIWIGGECRPRRCNHPGRSGEQRPRLCRHLHHIGGEHRLQGHSDPLRR